MLKKIEPRIVVPLVLGMMFALGDEASNPEGHIMQIKSALCVKVLLFCVLFCVFFRFADWLIAEVQEGRPSRALWLFRIWVCDKTVVEERGGDCRVLASV